MDKIVGTLMAFRMDWYNWLICLFLDSVYYSMNLCLKIKLIKFHFRSSSDLFRKSDPGYVSHPELPYNQLVEVADASCKMMCRVAAIHPRTT
jgi:hypothetical protein